MNRKEELDAIMLNFIWASNHMDEMKYVAKKYGVTQFQQPTDDLLYFWGTTEGIQLCLWCASLFCVIENLQNMLDVNIFEKFPSLANPCCGESTLYSTLKQFRNYCFHVDKSHTSDRFFDFIFRANEDVFSTLFDIHQSIGVFLDEEVRCIGSEFGKTNTTN